MRQISIKRKFQNELSHLLNQRSLYLCCDASDRGFSNHNEDKTFAEILIEAFGVEWRKYFPLADAAAGVTYLRLKVAVHFV